MRRGTAARLAGVAVMVLALLGALVVSSPRSAVAAADTPALSAPTSTVLVGQPLTFDYSAPADQVYPTNWIGLFLDKGCVTPSTHWLYTANGSTSTPSNAVASGSVTFDTTGWTPGSYTVCFLADDGYDPIGSPLTVQVVNAGVTATQTTVPPGTPVTLTYQAPADQVSTTNWIGWYRGATTCGSGSTYWDYTQTGTQSAPPSGSTPVASGTVTFTGMTEGSYAVCLLYNDGYTIIGSPIIINVAETSYPVTVTTSGHGTASAAPTQAAPGDQVTLSQSADPGYRFTGWQVTSPSDGSLTIQNDGTFTMPSAAVAVEADFVPDTATVHFEGNGADGGSMADQPVEYGVPVPLTGNAFSLTGSDFAGWATSPVGPVEYADGADFSDQVPTDGASITLFARWRGQEQFLVSVDDADHGSGTPSAGSAAPGASVALHAAPDAGYHFTGWHVVSPTGLAVGSDDTFTMPSSDVELGPRFDPNTYTVRYDGNGADAGTTSPSTFTYDTAAPLAPEGFARGDYRFTGWSTTPTGPVAYTDQETVKNLTADNGGVVTLYARWARLAVQPGSWSTLPAGFVTDTFKLPAVTASGAVSQPVLGLWNGPAPTGFTKVSGDAWLRVTADGTVTGRAPRQGQKYPGEITVSATAGGVTSTLLVEVPVAGPKDSPELKATTWNAWQNGAQVTDAVGKNLAVVAARGLGVIGFQDGGYRMAQSVGAALGWSVHGLGDLGIISPYPVVTGTSNPLVFPTDTVPAAAETVSVAGDPVRIWDVHLDESAYAPYRACFDGASPATLVSGEKATTRYAQAVAVARAMSRDLAARTPVVMLGDLASPAGSDWTARTSASHCHTGAVDWPVPDVFRRAGLLDSYRTANHDPVGDPGTTWSPVVTTNVNGSAEPQDRIDYVDYTPAGLTLTSSDTLMVGWPSATSPAGNSWASDHAAVVSDFRLNGGHRGH